MTKKEKNIIQDLIETEGLDYGFIEYSDTLEEVKDTEFHRLLSLYKEVRTNLINYLETQGIVQ